MQDKQKRILTLTIPSWSEKTGSDTMSNLLEGYGQDKVANIYFRGGTPTSNSCGSYFKINESRVIKSVLNRKIITGKRIDATCGINAMENDKEEKSYKFFHRHRSSVLLALRELLWFLGKWKSKELIEFIDDFKPDVIFFPIEGYFYFNRICRFVTEYSSKPAIGYLWDDNFSNKIHCSFFKKILRAICRISVNRSVKLCKQIFAISPKMKEECDKEFGVNSIIVTKGIKCNETTDLKYEPNKEKIKLLYAGNIYMGRSKSLAMLIECINEINESSDIFHLDVYTKSEIEKKYSSLFMTKGCTLHKAIDQSKLKFVRDAADILVFTEAIDKRADAARLSFSTKITDYFSSGKPILAIGREDVAPMEYLKMNNAAMCCDNKEKLKGILQEIVENRDILKFYSANAYELGKKNHNIELQRSRLHEALLKMS